MGAPFFLSRKQQSFQPQGGLPALTPLYRALGLIPFVPASGLAPTGGATLKVGAQGLGFNANASGKYWSTGQSNIISGSDTWSIVAGIQINQTTVSGGYSIYAERPNGTQIVKLVIGDLGNNATLVVRNSAGAIIQLAGTINVLDGKPHVIAAVRNGPSDHRLYVDGVLDASTATTIANSFGASIGSMIANDPQALTTSYFDGAISFVHLSRQAFSPTLVASLATNPWQVFVAQQRAPLFLVSGATAAALTGSATAAASGTGALSTSIPLSGVAAAVAAAFGSITTSIPLTGGAAGVASGTGALTTSIRLAGAASAVAAGAGSITTSIPLIGAASASAAGAGALSTAVALTGGASVVASASGSITTSIPLTGTAAASASATGTLTAPGTGLSGSATCSAAATGALTTAIPLSGTATCTAAASAALTAPGSGLTGSATCATAAAGALSTAIRLAGAAACTAVASASFSGSAAALSGSATCSAAASASLTTGIALVGAGGVSVFAVGALTTAIRLTGSASAVASATGSIGVEQIAYAPENILHFDPVNRILAASPPVNRTLPAGAPLNRTLETP